MKIVIPLLIATALAACGPMDTRSLSMGHTSSTMQLTRTYTGAGDNCTGQHKWLECRTQKTPAEANGGS